MIAIQVASSGRRGKKIFSGYGTNLEEKRFEIRS
jgi:hypothetical protein